MAKAAKGFAVGSLVALTAEALMFYSPARALVIFEVVDSRLVNGGEVVYVLGHVGPDPERFEVFAEDLREVAS